IELQVFGCIPGSCQAIAAIASGELAIFGNLQPWLALFLASPQTDRVLQNHAGLALNGFAGAWVVRGSCTGQCCESRGQCRATQQESLHGPSLGLQRIADQCRIRAGTPKVGLARSVLQYRWLR